MCLALATDFNDFYPIYDSCNSINDAAVRYFVMTRCVWLNEKKSFVGPNKFIVTTIINVWQAMAIELDKM